MNPTGSALSARSTSMMPNKLGLGAILAMIFAPKVEMRIDKRQDRYTGCLTGMNQIDSEINLILKHQARLALTNSAPSAFSIYCIGFHSRSNLISDIKLLLE